MESLVKRRKGGVFIIDCVLLKECRERYGCPANLFAKLAGWKKAWQSYLEKLEERQVNLKTLLKIHYTLGVLEGLKNDTAYFLNKNSTPKPRENKGEVISG